MRLFNIQQLLRFVYTGHCDQNTHGHLDRHSIAAVQHCPISFAQIKLHRLFLKIILGYRQFRHLPIPDTSHQVRHCVKTIGLK